MRFLFTILVAALLLAPRQCLHAQVVDGIMAVVGDSVITFEQVHSVLFERLRREPDMDDGKISAYQQNILNGLVNQQVILHDFQNLEKKGFVFPEAIIDEIIPEPDGGAHADHDAAAAIVEKVLFRHYNELKSQPVQQLLDGRYTKFREMARFFTE